jgi:hypothetical protein
MITLLDLTPIVDKLKTDCTLLQNRAFETVANNDAAYELFGSPAAFVYLANDASEPNAVISSVLQSHAMSIAVKTTVRKTQSLTDRLNTADAATLRTIRQQQLNALLGFKPVGAEKPLEHASGELTETERYLVWIDLYNTHDYLTNL